MKTNILVENINTDFEVQSLDTITSNMSSRPHPWWHQLKYLIAGIFFGIVLVKAELISWFRMQEMFRFQSFHLYGVMGSAIVVGMFSIWLIKRFHVKTLYGENIEFYPKKFTKGQVIGGLIFGMGWAMTGACPGPLFAQIGSGATVIIVTFFECPCRNRSIWFSQRKATSLNFIGSADIFIKINEA